MRNFRVYLLALLFLGSPLLRDSEDLGAEFENAGNEGEEVRIVEQDAQDVHGVGLSPAPGVDTVCFFPKNSAKSGEETEVLVGMRNTGQSSIDVVAVRGSIRFPFDQSLSVQNLTTLSFNNASVQTSAQATFPYVFAVSKYLQPGSFDLVGTIIYEIDGQPFQTTFHNGTIEVVESGGFVSVESVFLVSLGVALLVLLGLWIHGHLQRFTKTTKKAPKVEVGTATKDASMDEWLEGTAYARSLSSKSKKKK